MKPSTFVNLQFHFPSGLVVSVALLHYGIGPKSTHLDLTTADLTFRGTKVDRLGRLHPDLAQYDQIFVEEFLDEDTGEMDSMPSTHGTTTIANAISLLYALSATVGEPTMVRAYHEE